MSAAFTPADIESKVFKTVRLREGYDQAEVDDFLDECHAERTARVTRLARHDSTGALAVRLTAADVSSKLFRHSPAP